MHGGWDQQQLADALGIRSDEVADHVASHRLPPPFRFVARGPRWPVGTTWTPTHTHAEAMDLPRPLRKLYDEVCYWYWTQGHTDIPLSARGRRLPVLREDPTRAPTYALGVRVSQLRSAHRNGNLRPHESDLFSCVPGWTWSPHASMWERRFREIVARYPHQLSETDAHWIRTQRRRKADLSADKQQMLEAVPGLLTPADPTRVPQFVEAIRKWMRENRTDATNLSYAATVFMDGTPYPVGRRATYYRRRYRAMEGRGKNPLHAEEVELIESIPGWTWEQSPRHVHAGRVSAQSRTREAASRPRRQTRSRPAIPDQA